MSGPLLLAALVVGVWSVVAFIMTPVRTWHDLVAIPLIGVVFVVFGAGVMYLLSLLPRVLVGSVGAILTAWWLVWAVRAKMQADRREGP